MPALVYRYVFGAEIPLADIEGLIVAALLGTEALHGETQVRLDASHFLDTEARTCVVDASTPVGRDLNRLFLGNIRREFGDDGFQVKRIDKFERPPKST